MPERGWTSCNDLEIGDRCVDENGNGVAVVAKELVAEPVPVYNIEVEGAHTYYIGKNGKYVLVHNQCDPSSQPVGWWNDGRLSNWVNPSSYFANAFIGVVELAYAPFQAYRDNAAQKALQNQLNKITERGGYINVQDALNTYKASDASVKTVQMLAEVGVEANLALILQRNV